MTIRKLVAGLHQVGFKPGSCALINSMADVSGVPVLLDGVLLMQSKD